MTGRPHTFATTDEQVGNDLASLWSGDLLEVMVDLALKLRASIAANLDLKNAGKHPPPNLARRAAVTGAVLEATIDAYRRTK